MKSNKHSYLTGTLFHRYLLECLVWAAVLTVVCALFDFFFQRTVYFNENDLYLTYRTLYVGCVGVAIWGLIVLTLTYRLLKRAGSYIDEVQQAARQLVNDNDDLITLSPELAEIATSLNALKQESLHNARAAREAESRKSDLIMYLAHDLKTPLSSVIGYLTLLRDEPTLPADARQRYLATTLTKAERLDELINEFFDITRFNLSHVPLEYHQIDLARLLEQLVFECQPMLHAHDLHCDLQLPDELPMRCDPDKMQRVFDNLLRNAILYSYPSSTIRLTAERKDERAHVVFHNHGDTIPPEKLSRLFEQFYRLDSARGTTGGAGLGLAIAKEIVVQHGGSITAESCDNTITFTVTLPLNQPTLS